MKAYIEDIRELTDSREMLNSRPHRFMAWFIYLLILLIAAAAVWSYFGEIEEYVKATGVVRPGDSIGTVRNATGGYISELFIEDGVQVQKGDVLFVIETKDLFLNQAERVRALDRLTNERENLDLLRQSIQTGTNLFDPADSEARDYYNQFDKYMTDRKSAVEQADNSVLDLRKLIDDSEASKKRAKKNLLEAELLLRVQNLFLSSVERDENLLEPSRTDFYEDGELAELEAELNGLYGRKYESHELAKIGKALAISQARDEAETAAELYEFGAVTLKELEAARQKAELAELDSDKYLADYLLSLRESIRQTKQSIQDLHDSIEQYALNIDAYNGKSLDVSLMLDKMRLDALVQIDGGLTSNKKSLEQVEGEIRAIALSIESATVTAPISGIVNMPGELNVGEMLGSGAEVASIIPNSGADLKISLMILNADIASIKERQSIKYHFSALPYREYGEADGAVEKIGTDAQNAERISFYMVEASLKDSELTSYKGVTEKIKVGMTCEAQVVTGSKKIIRWLLEKINLTD